MNRLNYLVVSGAKFTNTEINSIHKLQENVSIVISEA